MNRFFALSLIFFVSLAVGHAERFSPSALAQFEKPAGKGSAPEFRAVPDGGWHVLYGDGDGVRCDRATPEQIEAFLKEDAAELRPVARLTPNQSAGLKITLLATSQLQANKQALDAFVRAAERWESRIKNPIMVQLRVDFGPTRFGSPYPAGVIGSTSSQEVAFGPTGYEKVRAALKAGASSTEETAVYNALPGGSARTDLGTAYDCVGTSINLRGLGLLPPVANPAAEPELGTVPSIGFNSAFTFDFDPSNGISPGLTDFDGVVTHEIGHALGFVSEVDGGEFPPIRLSVWDLFRFRPGTASRDFTNSPRVRQQGGQQVFTTGGSFKELACSTGRTSGDGRQASHWQDDSLRVNVPAGEQYIGIMDPTLGSGFRASITDNDLKMLEAVGYRLSDTGLVDSEAPTVTLTNPKAGVALEAGFTTRVTWAASDDRGLSRFDLKLSTDGGTSFPTVIASGLSGSSTSFLWDVPSTLQSETARLQITAIDFASNQTASAGEGAFRVIPSQGGGLRPPSNLTGAKDGSRVNLKWQSPFPVGRSEFDAQDEQQGALTEQEPNSTLATVQKFKPNAVITGSVAISDQGQFSVTLPDGTGDDFEDLYQFEVTEPTRVSMKLDFTPSNADLDMWVLAPESNLTILFDGGATGSNPELVTLDLNPGSYVIAISNFEPGPPNPPPTATYTLTVTMPGGVPQPVLKGFNLYRSTSAVAVAPGNLVVNLPPAVTSFTDNPTVTDGKTAYNYAVTALYDTGESALSNTATVTPDASVETVPPTVQVRGPNDGLVPFFAGGTMLISWSSDDNVGVVSHDVALSTDGGTTFGVTVATGLSGAARSFTYSIPTTVTTTRGRIRVTAKDAAGNQGSDASDGDFTINPPDATAPTVRVLAPNGGDKAKAGSTLQIRWQSSDNIRIATHDVLLSTDGGATYPTRLASGLAGTAQSFDFAVPTTQPAAKQARIRVVARDAAGNAGQDDSDANFKIKAKK